MAELSDDEARRTPVSIVCVFNAPDVLASCLERSIREGRADAPLTELIAVDNCGGEFATAGAALNHGASQAHNDVVVFVHQDVYLHSLPELERAASELFSTPHIGVMGAVGIDGSGRIVGRIRDRVIGLGEPAPVPRDVESMDEVLFMVTRDRVRREPLADDARLGWHAYAVEYSARIRAAGLRAVVRDIPLTHNSLSTNLRNLDVAHRRVGDSYPALLPLRTTCGTIHSQGGDRRTAVIGRRAQGLARWHNESRAASGARGLVPIRDVVLADVRFAIDEIASRSGASTLRALDHQIPGGAATEVDGLERFGLPTSAATVDLAMMVAEIARRPPGELTVLANLEVQDLGALDLAGIPRIVGFSHEARLWVVLGVSRSDLGELWRDRRTRPYAGIPLFSKGASA
ncbi:glycosyltransferase [Salinibacterium sp. PAMC 21357]|uniref:glycosyltransferase n=1 Tax=Salinibacterium sp. PAMC 21357 TaxID=1112215 RepID=UPI000287AF6D|nr:glycosyltransferase [Salinibacterium sp. PAMC 21357]